MLSYWFPEPLSFWWPLVLAMGFAIIAVFAVFATLTRRREEADAHLIATFYGVGLGLAALSEFLMFLDVAFNWSLATALAVTATQASLLAVVVAAIAFLTVIIAIGMQFQEETNYRSTHRLAQ
ncbi:MAG: hypothetical protein ACM3N4_06835 [Nitrososphaerota archaeon]